MQKPKISGLATDKEVLSRESTHTASSLIDSEIGNQDKVENYDSPFFNFEENTFWNISDMIDNTNRKADTSDFTKKLNFRKESGEKSLAKKEELEECILSITNSPSNFQIISENEQQIPMSAHQNDLSHKDQNNHQTKEKIENDCRETCWIKHKQSVSHVNRKIKEENDLRILQDCLGENFKIGGFLSQDPWREWSSYCRIFFQGLFSGLASVFG